MIKLKIIKKTHSLLNLGTNRIKRHLFSGIFIVGLITIIGFTTTSQAKNNTTDSDSYYTNFQSKIDASMGQDPNLTNTYNNSTLSTNMLNLNGPLQVSLAWSDVYGAMLQTHYANLLSDRNAIAIEGNLGTMQNRINVTLGHVFSPKNRIKITAERLSQKQTFDFYSGSIDEWVSQYAGGAELQHLIGSGFFNNVSAGGYYAYSGSKSLDPIIYTDAGTPWINYRHIAGANSTGGHVSFGLKPWKTGMLTLTSYYDSVNYNTEYSDVSAEDSSSLGYGVALEQYIASTLKATAEYSHRALYDTIQGSIQWFHNIRHNKAAIGMSLGYAHHNYNDASSATNSENMLTIGLQYYFMPIKDGYTMPKFNFQSLTAWTSEPAVRMDKVMATADQEKQLINLSWEDGQITANEGYNSNSEIISWHPTATSNTPGTSLKYTLSVLPQDKDDTYPPYNADVTNLNSTIVTGLTPEHTYKAIVTVTDTITKKSVSNDVVFTTDTKVM